MNPFQGKSLLAASLCLMFLFTGCSEIAKKKEFSEGYIEYNVEYDDSLQPPTYSANMRPNKMIIKFKDSNTINKIEGMSGAFSFTFIQNKQNQKAYILIKLLNKKLFYQEPLTPNTFPFAYNDSPLFTIQKSNEPEEFMGYTCQRALACYKDSIHQPFSILYTNEIGVSNPNSNSPFQEIDGIMLKFSAIMFNQKMNITASTIRGVKLSDDEFLIPPGYEEVGLDVVKDVIDLLK